MAGVFTNSDCVHAVMGDGIVVSAAAEPSTWMMAIAGPACGGCSIFRRRKLA